MTTWDDVDLSPDQPDYELKAQLRRLEFAIRGAPREKGKGGLKGDLRRFKATMWRVVGTITVVALALFLALFFNGRYNQQQSCIRGNQRSASDTKRLYDQGREYARAIGGTDAQADVVTRRLLKDDPPPVRSCPAILPLVKS